MVRDLALTFFKCQIKTKGW